MRPGVYALRLAIAFAPILAVQYPRDVERDKLHAVISEFLSRGQLVVETLPPFTFLIQSFIDRAWPSASNKSPLDLCGAIADLLLVVSALLAFDLDFRSSCIWTTHLLEMTALLPVLFGRNWSNILLCISLIQLKRLYLAFKRLGDTETSMVCKKDGFGRIYQLIKAQVTIFLHLVVPPIFAFLCICGCVITAFVVVFPSSESSSGGNYNLHYLPADFRRSLRSFVNLNGTHTAAGIAQAPLDSVLDKPITLYVQNAGFLWTDSAVWDAEISAFGRDEYVRDLAMESTSKAYRIPEFLNHRVVFEDRIKRVCTFTSHPFTGTC